jgi:hypothetical protein
MDVHTANLMTAVPRDGNGQDHTSFLVSEQDISPHKLPQVVGRIQLPAMAVPADLIPQVLSRVTGRPLRNVNLPRRIYSNAEGGMLLFWYTKAFEQDIIDRMEGYPVIDDNLRNNVPGRNGQVDGTLNHEQYRVLTHKISTRASRARIANRSLIAGGSPVVGSGNNSRPTIMGRNLVRSLNPEQLVHVSSIFVGPKTSADMASLLELGMANCQWPDEAKPSPRMPMRSLPSASCLFPT